MAGSYLFSSYLQASNLSTAATMVALYAFIQHRLVATSIFLGIAGIFHANFLILNGALFGLVHFFQNAPLSLTSRSKWRNWLFETAWILGPTAIIIGISMPLILSISQTELGPNEAALAQNILFDLAGPWHYKPTTFLVDFFDLAGWQLLGMTWTWLAIPHNHSRRFWLTIQGVLIVLIWTATALTTVVFIEQVSRFFVWRLAPFSMLIALLLFLCGAMRALHEPLPNFRTRVSVIGLSFLALVLVAGVIQYHGSILSFQGAKILSIPLILLSALTIKWFLPHFWLTCRQLRPLVFSPLVAAMVLIGFGGATFLTLYSFDRYNLLFNTLVPLQKDELYRWVRTHSPSDAQFVIPPLQMEKFRLLAERAIVVDFKNRPLSASHLLEWYHRMEAITGTKNPKTQKELIDGYSQIDEVRLETLRKKYGITHAVLPRSSREHPLVGWTSVFENTAYRVLASPNKNPQQITKKPAIENFRARVDSF